MDPTARAHQVKDRIDAAVSSWSVIENQVELVVDTYRKRGGPSAKPSPSLSQADLEKWHREHAEAAQIQDKRRLALQSANVFSSSCWKQRRDESTMA